MVSLPSGAPGTATLASTHTTTGGGGQSWGRYTQMLAAAMPQGAAARADVASVRFHTF